MYVLLVLLVYIYVYINNMLEIIRNEKIFLLYKNFTTVVVDSLMALQLIKCI